jgi:SAM-dependent methyltransferase
VGWPTLCEEFNRLKYQSEGDACLSILHEVKAKYIINILEVGVGIGFWTSLQRHFFAAKGSIPEITILDISRDALTYVRNKFPEVNAIEADLTTLSIDCFAGQFDLVTAIMVLLHFTDVECYLRGLKLCARSVTDGGCLLLYEPAISCKFSPYASQPFDSNENNSVPRHLNMIDNVMTNEGFRRIALQQGASWLLNSPIQAETSFGFAVRRLIWEAMVKLVYRNDRLTEIFGSGLTFMDKYLKTCGTNSGSFILYKREARNCSARIDQ